MHEVNLRRVVAQPRAANPDRLLLDLSTAPDPARPRCQTEADVPCAVYGVLCNKGIYTEQGGCDAGIGSILGI